MEELNFDAVVDDFCGIFCVFCGSSSNFFYIIHISSKIFEILLNSSYFFYFFREYSHFWNFFGFFFFLQIWKIEKGKILFQNYTYFKNCLQLFQDNFWKNQKRWMWNKTLSIFLRVWEKDGSKKHSFCGCFHFVLLSGKDLYQNKIFTEIIKKRKTFNRFIYISMKRSFWSEFDAR